MRSTTRVRLFALSALAAAVTLAGHAAVHAQNYPNRPIRLIVPTAPGGGMDVMGRFLAQKITQALPYPVIVENRPGANWVIGMEAVAKSPPDGYTLLFMPSPGVTLTPLTMPSLSFDPLADLTAIAPVSRSTFVLLVSPKLQVNSVGELVAHLRANPGKLNHAYNSATTLLISELFKTRSDVSYVDVAYRSGGQAVQATLEGTTDFTFVDIVSAMPAIEGKTLRPLGMTGEQRVKFVSHIPTFGEQGINNFVVYTFQLVFAPLHTPAPITTEINKAFAKVLDAPEVHTWLSSIAQEPLAGTADVIAKTLASERQQWDSLIKARSIKFTK